MTLLCVVKTEQCPLFNLETVVTEFDGKRTGQSYTYYRHEAVVNGLTSGTDYKYRILVDGQDILSDQDLYFRTACVSPFKFLVVGDTGLGEEAQALIAARMQRERVRLLVHTGDLVYPTGTYEAYESRYFKYYRPMMKKVPFFPCPGNHDYYEHGGEPYVAVHDLPTEQVQPPDHGRYYSYDWYNVHFVSLDSNDTLANAARGLSPMLKWLDDDLAQTKKFWRIVYFHHPPYATGIHALDPLGALAREHIVPILEKHRIPIVFSGHEHSYQRTLPMFKGQPTDGGNGTVYMITGGGGAPLYSFEPAPHIAAGASKYHYLSCEVDGSRMSVSAFDSEGVEFDAFAVAPPPILEADSVVNGASFDTTIGRGGLISIFGLQLASADFAPRRAPLPTELAGVTVTLNDELLPLIMVSPTQINAVIPMSASGSATLKVVTKNGSAQTAVTIHDLAPAIFSSAQFHDDGRRVSGELPAVPGEMITLYATGLGAVEGDASVPANAELPVRARIRVLIDGTSIIPVAATLVEGLVGVYKVSFVLPRIRVGTYRMRLQADGAISNEAFVPVGTRK